MTGTDNWRCSHCGRAFPVPSLLGDHIAEHELYGTKTD